MWEDGSVKMEVFIMQQFRSREPAFATRFFCFGGGFAAAETKKELRHAAQSGLIKPNGFQKTIRFRK